MGSGCDSKSSQKDEEGHKGSRHSKGARFSVVVCFGGKGGYVGERGSEVDGG